MCGIAGILDLSAEITDSVLTDTIGRMSQALFHRGPDDGGCWLDVHAGIGLGARRLAIIDLSPEGHQPMHSASGRFVIVFNGEIYNFRELRCELGRRGHRFRGHSDTEVILAAVEEWGLLEAVTQFNGMFAFALWDRTEQTLHLVRDRMGEKPLYFGQIEPAHFIFASELKALHAHPRFSATIDREALVGYTQLGYVPAPWSIFAGIRKVLPATILTIRADKGASPVSQPYWSLLQVVEEGRCVTYTGSDEDVGDQLEAALAEAVRSRMVADVPVGAFLSGGIDSSTVVALMQAGAANRVRTFSVAMDRAAYNEAPAAGEVARYLGTDHTELFVSTEEAQNVIPLLATIYDEPFADSSQIPTYLISKLARELVTVSLSGDGGDEIFGGYERYLWGDHVWKTAGRLPKALRRVAAGALLMLSPSAWDVAAERARRLLPRSFRVRTLGDKIQKASAVLSATSAHAFYRGLITQWDPRDLVVGSPEAVTVFTWPGGWPLTETMMYLDAITYLPDDILVKLDRATMAVSLEARAPFLDHRLIEFAWRLPMNFKVRKGRSKWLLRHVLHKHVPERLVDRPKTGFAVSLDSWLRGDLRSWAEDLLSAQRLAAEGFFNPRLIRSRWHEHLAGRRNHHAALWAILMFESWLEQEKRLAHLRSASFAVR